MTDWKAGDRFKLECEGEYLDEDLHEDAEVYVRVDGIRPQVRCDIEWFDAHATKIQPRCSANVVKANGSAMPCGEIAVQQVTNSEEVRYFCSAHRMEAVDL